jgi:hypothetical protein
MSEVEGQIRNGGGHPVDGMTSNLLEAGKRGIQLSLAAQKALIEEIYQASGDALAHTKAQMHVANEFASKMAEAHSFRDLVSVYQECSRHQMDLVRKDSERLAAYGQSLLEKSFSYLREAGQPLPAGTDDIRTAV